MTQEITFTSKVPAPSEPPSRWQENHGNLLLAFVGVVFFIGGCILLYRQNRFVPPRFPESDMIETPGEATGEPVVAGDGNQGSVKFRVTGAGNDFGTIKIAVYDSESVFNESQNAIESETLSILDGEAQWTVPIERLPAKFAVAAFHDENADDELNRNRLGIPSERYGFSRNARSLTGPPSFKQAVINRPKSGETIDLFVR